MGPENRKSPRNKTYAKVILEGSGVLGYLRDLSKEGCQLAFVGNPRLNDGDLITIEVLPAEEMEIPRFSMTVRIMWTRNDPVYYIAGGLIASVKDGQRLERLFEYYA
ncbi:MAG: PilZ domain-containing protein [Spirochaetaceae bacterium]|nr:MAG: PilZ domain-containing protein [Spirochaetaceae bacterium]